MNYTNIKKYSLLRDFRANGFNIGSLLDTESTDLNKYTHQLNEFEKMTLNDIVAHFTLKLINVQDKWQTNTIKKSYTIDEDIDNLLDSLQESPDYGHPSFSPLHNSVVRGLHKGQLHITSAGSGNGKTTHALANVTQIACSEIYDTKLNKYVSNGNQHACSFISTELDLRQIQLTLLSIISKVNRTQIKDGRYSEDIKIRLEKAIQIIKESPIYLHYLPEYSVSDLKQIIEKDVLQHNVEYVFHDYIMFNQRLAKEAQQKYGYAIREDLVLVDLSNNLKQLAEFFNIHISSSTQLNRNSNDREQRNASSIRGGHSIIDKCDVASMIFRATEKDLTDIEHILKNGFYTKPTTCEYLFKNRNGESNLIIWYKRNLGNMEIEPCFVTDLNYELQTHIQPLKIQFNEVEACEENPFR